METKESLEYCPICYKLLSVLEIESHVNKCIFLNSVDEQDDKQKRKRSASPVSCNSAPKRVKDQTVIKKQKSNSPTGSTTSKYVYNSQCEDVDLNAFTTTISEQMQPRTIDEFVGQEKVLGKNTFLRSLLVNNEIPNIILWGPPGCGKTSLAKVIREICKNNSQKYRYIGMSAVDCGIKDIHNIIDEAKTKIKHGQRTVLFIDEVHRLHKRQQNTLLVAIVNGSITLISATTENPSFIMTDSFLRHCKVIVMEKLDISHLISIVERALASYNVKIIDDQNTIRNLFQNSHNRLSIRHSAVRWLAETTDGDARIALNNVQLVLQHNKGKKCLSIADIKNQIKKSHLMYDCNGEDHHNIISAMHESIKGYSDNATLYWTARMIAGGEDPLFIARRLVRAASEDTGNADPRALQFAVSTMHGCQLIGMPDTDVLLAQCAIYLARAPTTKQIKLALALAKQVISDSKGQQPDVPVHLRNAPIKLMRELGYEESSKKCRSFMPAGLEGVKFL